MWLDERLLRPIANEQDLLARYVEAEKTVISEYSTGSRESTAALRGTVIAYAAEHGLTVDAEWFQSYVDMYRDEWPVHQPEATDAPIPGRHWYSGCEPGGDWNYEFNRYEGSGPRVDPATGICEGCGERACRECGRENCPDHPESQ